MATAKTTESAPVETSGDVPVIEAKKVLILAVTGQANVDAENARYRYVKGKVNNLSKGNREAFLAEFAPTPAKRREIEKAMEALLPD